MVTGGFYGNGGLLYGNKWKQMVTCCYGHIMVALVCNSVVTVW